MSLYRLLLYLTNNGTTSSDEKHFDIIFWCIASVVLVLGIFLLFYFGEPQWIAFLIIEYIWAWDNLRHNR